MMTDAVKVAKRVLGPRNAPTRAPKLARRSHRPPPSLPPLPLFQLVFALVESRKRWSTASRARTPSSTFLPSCPPNTHAVPSAHTLFHTDKRSTPSVTPTCPLCSLYLPPRFSVSHTHALAHGTPRPDLHFTPVPYTSPDPAPLLRLRPPPRRPPPRTAAPASASPASPPLSPPSASRRWWPSIATTPRSQSATPSRRGPPPRRPSPRRPPPSASCTMSSCAPFSPIATASI